MTEPQLEASAFFHGFLDSADLPEFLKKSGDFLCRFSMANVVNEKHAYTVSVVICKGDDKKKENKLVRSYSPLQNDDGTLSFDTIHSKTTILELINYHLKYQKPIADDVVITHAISRKKWELRPADVEVDTEWLGEGKYGGVAKGLIRSGAHKQFVAIKRLKNDNAEAGNDLLAQMLSEARMMRRINHHVNVVKFMGASLDREPILIAMELVDGGDMAKALRTQRVPDDCRLALIIAAALGLSYVHGRGVIHRDVAARNCLINAACTTLKLCDFGLSRPGPNYDVKKTRSIPFKWMAPEALQARTFSYKTDVWAFGVTVWEVYNNGEDPYTGLSSQATMAQLLDKREPLQFVRQGKIPVPPEVVDLIEKQVFDFNPQTRSTMAVLTDKLEAIAAKQPVSVQRKCQDFIKAAKEESRSSMQGGQRSKTDGSRSREIQSKSRSKHQRQSSRKNDKSEERRASKKKSSESLARKKDK